MKVVPQNKKIPKCKSSKPPKAVEGRNRAAFVCNDTRTLFLFRKEAIIELVKAGYHITIIAPFDEHVGYFVSKGVHFHKLNLNRQGKNVREEYRSYKEILSAYSLVAPDIVFHYTIKLNIYGSIAAKKLGIPCVSIVPGLGQFPDASNYVFKSILKKGYSIAAKLSSEIWFLNNQDHRYFLKSGWLGGTPSQVLPGEGIDTNVFYYKKRRTNDVLNVLYLGRLLVDKGARTFAETARRASKQGLRARFDMVGFIDESHSNGVRSEELNTWIQKGWIQYHGSTKSPQKVIEKSDIIVVPTSYREGLNRVIQESLAIGRPVVTTSVPGAGELIEHNKTGYIVPPNAPDAIVDALQLFLSLSEEKQCKMGIEGSKSIIGKYDVRKVLPYYWDAIARLCEVTTPVQSK